MCKTVDILNEAIADTEKAKSIVRVAGCTLDQAFAILRFERETQRRQEKLKHLRATQHGHLFGENRCCTRCGLLETTYRMEHEHLDLDKVITCDNIIDLQRYNAYLGIGIYMKRSCISDP